MAFLSFDVLKLSFKAGLGLKAAGVPPEHWDQQIRDADEQARDDLIGAFTALGLSHEDGEQAADDWERAERWHRQLVKDYLAIDHLRFNDPDQRMRAAQDQLEDTLAAMRAAAGEYAALVLLIPAESGMVGGGRLTVCTRVPAGVFRPWAERCTAADGTTATTTTTETGGNAGVFPWLIQ